MMMILCIYLHPIKAQTYKLNFEPKGKIVKIIYDSMTFYTDTNALLGYDTYFIYMGKDVTLEKALQVVRNEIKENKEDTITFSGEVIKFYDPESTYPFKRWYVWSTLQKMIEDKNVKWFDKNNHEVKYVYIKETGTRFKGKITTQYINLQNNEVIREETMLYIKWWSRIF